MEWPPGLDVFVEADWPPPESGPDPGAVGLRDWERGTEAWLAEVLAPGNPDPGLAAVWRTTFAYRRWVAAKLAWLGEDHPLHMHYWIELVGRELSFVREYAMKRDGRPESREW